MIIYLLKTCDIKKLFFMFKLNSFVNLFDIACHINFNNTLKFQMNFLFNFLFIDLTQV